MHNKTESSPCLLEFCLGQKVCRFSHGTRTGPISQLMDHHHHHQHQYQINISSNSSTKNVAETYKPPYYGEHKESTVITAHWKTKTSTS